MDVLAPHRDAMAQLCRRHGVQRLEVFGSALRARRREACGDLDFLVSFDRRGVDNAFEQFFAFPFALERLPGRPAQLLTEQELTNPYFARSVRREKRLVHAARSPDPVA